MEDNNISISTDIESSIIINDNNKIEHDKEEYEHNSIDDDLNYESDEFDFSLKQKIKITHTTKRERLRNDMNERKHRKHNQSSFDDLIDKINILKKPKIKGTFIDLEPFSELSDQFKSIEVSLKLASYPSEFGTKRQRAADDNESFLMDLRRDNGEYIIIFPGVGTKLKVISVDKKFSQLVLSVTEPERNTKVIQKNYNTIMKEWEEKVLNVHVDPEERTFLIGKDEGHLFIAGLKDNVSSVKSAHVSLMPERLRGKRDGYFIRQGEWFFVPVNHELSLPIGMEPEQHGLSSGHGRDHNAEWYVKIGNEEYVKGSITHPEHKTLMLKDWHRVYCNKETVNQVKGMNWID